MAKKAAAALLCVLLTLSLCACKKSGKSENTAAERQKAVSDKTARILYCHTDSLDPYSLKTKINRQLCALLYEPLVKTDGSFQPVLALAQSVENGGTVVKVTLKDAKFSDGSKITVNDVIYSYERARSSESVYGYELYEVVSLAAADSKTLVFTLSQNDPYFENLLDFPIIKSGSDKITDSDGVLKPPVSCGRYVLSEDGKSLAINPLYYGKQGVIGKIELIAAPDDEALSHYVEVGAASFYYTDLAGGKIARMDSKRADVNLNALVYIGINERRAGLNSKNMRYAISSAVNREAICKTAYYNNAVAATGFFAPWFADTKAVQSINPRGDKQITVENLDKIGYNNLDKKGYLCSSAGVHPTFSLLVNSENPSRVSAAELIAKQLREAGIEINVVKKPYSQYVDDLAAGRFDLYLGEINVLFNMDMSALCLAGGSAAYGITPPVTETEGDGEKSAESVETAAAASENSAVRNIIDGYHSGQNGITEVAGTLLTEMPQIPVCYRQGIFFYSTDIKSKVNSYASDIYFSIENVIFK